MKTRRFRIRFGVVCLVTVILLAGLVSACAEPEPEPTPTAPAPTTPAPTAPAPTTPAPTTPAPTTPAPPTPAPPTPAPTEAKWWDKLGVPQYGGTLTIARNTLGDQFDHYMPFTANWQPYENLFMWDMSIDREEWSYKVGGAPPNCVGQLAESWEWSDPQTLVVKLRQGVKWQDKPPTYGREFTSDDVVYNYDRILGTGSGFTEPNPFTRVWIEPVELVTAQDKYTVVIKFKGPETLINWWAITDAACPNMMMPREFVELNDPSDWTNVAGTGAFIVTDYVAGSSLTLSRNPDYYMYDERYPDNQLPYLDTLKLLYILDISTQLAAIRSGQVDMVFELDWQTAGNLQKTNPDIMVTSRPYQGFQLDLRCDNEPFTDIRVRKALQLAIDTYTIAETHYGGSVSGDPPSYLSTEYKGWTKPYAEWPEDLKEEYSYNPEKAKQLLAEAGYPDGFDTNCYVATNDDLDLVQIMKNYFADINVNMTINTMDRNQFIPFTQTGKHDQMAANFFCNMTFPVNISLTNRTSEQSTNIVHAAPEEAAAYDAFYLEFMKAPDEAAAKKIMLQAEDYIYRQHWAINATSRVFFDAARPRVGGFSGESIVAFGGVWFQTRLWVKD